MSTYAFVYAGVWLAPSFKKEVALLLTILISMIGAVLIFAGYLVEAEYFSYIAVISGIIGVIIGYLQIQEKINDNVELL